MRETFRIVYYHLGDSKRLVYVRKVCREHEHAINITALKKKKQILGFHFLKHFSYITGF